MKNLKYTIAIALVTMIGVNEAESATSCGSCGVLTVCGEVFGSTDPWQHWCSWDETVPQKCKDQEKRWALCQSAPGRPADWAWETKTGPWKLGFTCISDYCF